MEVFLEISEFSKNFFSFTGIKEIYLSSCYERLYALHCEQHYKNTLYNRRRRLNAILYVSEIEHSSRENESHMNA